MALAANEVQLTGIKKKILVEVDAAAIASAVPLKSLPGYVIRSSEAPSTMLDAAAEMMAESFMEEPVYIITFADPAVRSRGVKWVLSRRILLWLEHSLIYFEKVNQTDDKETANRENDSSKKEVVEICGHIALTPPANSKMAPSLWRLVQIGLWQWPFRFGISSMRSFLGLVDRCSTHEAEVFSRKNALDDGAAWSDISSSSGFWTIQAFCIAKHLQGKGVGRRLLKDVITTFLVHDAGSGGSSAGSARIVLLTEREINVRFYQDKCGWSLIDHTVFENLRDTDGNSCSMPIWALELHVPLTVVAS